MTTIDNRWSNFESWLRSPPGWLFYLLLFVLVLSILVNLVVFARRLQDRRGVETGLGRTLAVAGGSIVLVATFLPWVGYGGSAVSYSVPHGVVANGITGVLVYAFGLVWLTLFAIPKKVAAILGFLWGGLALVLTLMTSVWIASLGDFYIEYGVYVSMLGSIILVVGSAFAYLEANKAGARGPAELAQPTLPMP